jgi:heat shock protein 4
MVQPLLDRLLVSVQQALRDANQEPDKLFALEITGGATRLTAVQQRLTEFFKRDISKTLNFEESVAKGCALQVRAAS